jgi:hypothetical protein
MAGWRCSREHAYDAAMDLSTPGQLALLGCDLLAAIPLLLLLLPSNRRFIRTLVRERRESRARERARHG